MSHQSRFHLAVCSLILLGFMPSFAASAQDEPASMWAQMVKLGGMMHATAQVCGGYSDEQLEELKQQQKANTLERGVSAAEFEKVFTEAETMVGQRWESMSPAQQSKACADIKQQMSTAP